MFDKWIKNADDQIIGFDCPYHGGKVLYSGGAAFADKEDLICPTCGRPICPDCANMFEDKPRDPSDAQDYLMGAMTGNNRAWCGGCGEYGYEYTLKYLKLIGCELPENYSDWQSNPEDFRVIMSQRVAVLPDMPVIAKDISSKFTAGQRGIIKYKHATGELWGIPENQDGSWIVNVCYPEER